MHRKETILVIAAHPDDEAIGCAGTLKKHATCGDSVYAVSFTNGVSSRNNTPDNSINERLNSANNSAKKIGFQWVKLGDFPDNELDTISLLTLTKFIEDIKKIIQPTIIYTHSAVDLNIDHRRVHEATLIAFRPQPGEIWKEIRTYEVASSTEWGIDHFKPNLFVDVTQVYSHKKKALLCYQQEMRDYPHTRSLDAIENINRYRGSQAGFILAEAFEVIRSRWF